MPDHKLHRTLDILLFGRDFPEVHKLMDSLQPILQSNHRIAYHDMETVRWLAEHGGPLAGAAGYYHILLDMYSDKFGQERAIPCLLYDIQRGRA